MSEQRALALSGHGGVILTQSAPDRNNSNNNSNNNTQVFQQQSVSQSVIRISQQYFDIIRHISP